MSPTRLSNLTIVVVEDHNDIRSFLGIFLSHLGAKVVVAGNAIEGLAAVKTYHPNLVLSDISMPGRDGFGLRVWPFCCSYGYSGLVSDRRSLTEAKMPRAMTSRWILENQISTWLSHDE
jgi:Response regulator receiver domain